MQGVVQNVRRECMVRRGLVLDGHNPYPGKTSEQKKYTESAFGYILNGYFDDDNTKIILFCWLMHSDFMFDIVTSHLKEKNYELVKIALICRDKEVYIERKKRDGRRDEQITETVDMQRFIQLNADIIDVAHMSISEVVEKIRYIAHLR